MIQIKNKKSYYLTVFIIYAMPLLILLLNTIKMLVFYLLHFNQTLQKKYCYSSLKKKMI